MYKFCDDYDDVVFESVDRCYRHLVIDYSTSINAYFLYIYIPKDDLCEPKSKYDFVYSILKVFQSISEAYDFVHSLTFDFAENTLCDKFSKEQSTNN